MKCKFCGMNVLDGEGVCRNCGNRIEKTDIALNKDEFLRIYAGKNSEKVLYKKWSWPTFFFGPVYLLYRKMWMLGFLVIVIQLILSFLISSALIVFIVKIIIYVFLAVNFSSAYYEQADKTVTEILKKSTNREEIILNCQKRGGTSTSVAIVFGLIYFVDFAFNYFLPFLFLLWLFFRI